MPHPVTYLVRALLIAGLGIMPAASHAASKPVPVISLDRIMVVVENSVIMQSEVEARMRSARRNLAQRNIALPPNEILERQVIEAMILEQLQVDTAKRRGIQVSEAEIDQIIEGVARQNGMSLPAFLKKVERDGVSQSQLREDFRRQLLMRQLVDQEINREIQVSESEVDNFLSEQGQRGAEQDFNLSHILIAVGESAPSEERKQAVELANQIREKLLAGESFEKMAITYSKGPNALKGGGLGWREAGRLPDVFVSALESIRPGEITPVLESANGYHLLRLNGKRGGQASGVVTQTNVRHILLKPSEVQSLDAATDKLNRLRERALAGEKFDVLARAHSEDAGSASQGGSLGWMSPGQLVAEFEKAMEQLKPGEISKPVQTRFGVHLIQVLDRRTQDLGNERQRLSAKQQIHARKAEERLQQWQRELRDQAYVEIIPDPGT
jgi:peptidyl-prolyl cis-trans isomerase SurA